MEKKKIKYYFQELSGIENFVDELISGDSRVKKLMEKGVTRDELIGFRIYEQFMYDCRNDSAITEIRKKTGVNFEKEIQEIVNICASHYDINSETLKNYIENIWKAMKD